MTEWDALGSISSNWTDKNGLDHQFCIHCSSPLVANCSDDYDENFPDSFLQRNSVYQISSSASLSSSSKVPLSQVLSSIFKLNYLKAFTTTHLVTDQQQEDDEEEQLLSLCLHCGQVLTHLYQLYNDFVQLGKLESYLSNKLRQLNQIMDHHSEVNIKCDLKERLNITNTKEDYDQQSHQDYSHFYSNQFSDLDNVANPNFLSPAVATRTTITPSTNFEKEPRILLTRLSEKYLKLLPPSSHRHGEREGEEETVFSDICVSSPEHDDDEEYTLPENVVIKTETELDDEPMDPTTDTDDDALSSQCQKNFKNSNNNFFKTTEAAAAGNRKSMRLSRKKSRKTTTTPDDETTKSEKMKRKRKSGSVSTSKKARIAKFKNQYPICQQQNDDPNISSSNHDDDVTAAIPSQQSQNGLISVKKKTNKSYFVYRTKYANPCWYCPRTDFPSPASCREHTTKEHLPQLFMSSKKRKLAQICTRCSKICPNVTSLEFHLKKCTSFPSGVILPKLYACPECPKSFAVKSCLTVHMQLLHSTERPFQCDQCPYQAKLLHILNSHKLNVHTVTPREVFRCPECPQKSFKNKNSFQWHKSCFHNPDRNRECLKKEKKRRQEKRLARPSTLTTICSDCGGVNFYNRLAYVNHRRSVHADNMGRNYVCDQCGSAFSTASNLHIHMNLHSEERPFLCPKCGKAFKSNGNLVKHDRNTHTTEGRLRHNEQVRAEARRRKLVAMQLAQFKEKAAAAGVINEDESLDTSSQQSSEQNDVNL